MSYTPKGESGDMVELWRLEDFLNKLEKKTGDRCPVCKASLKQYWHTITPGMINGLIKFKRAVVERGENKIHLLEDMTGKNKLSRHEWNNWTRLRFHALVAKHKTDGEHDAGYWLLTRRGSEFLLGEAEIPQKVKTFRNRVIGYSEEKVKIKDVVGKMPYFEKKFDFDLFNTQQKLV